jgi:hypothetical protein
MREAIYLDDLAVGRKFVTGSTTLTLEGVRVRVRSAAVSLG